MLKIEKFNKYLGEKVIFKFMGLECRGEVTGVHYYCKRPIYKIEIEYKNLCEIHLDKNSFKVIKELKC